MTHHIRSTMLEEKPNEEELFGSGILKCFFGFKFKPIKSVKVDLNGERIISSLKVWRPKYEAPILAETKKNKDTETIDRNVNNQEMGSTKVTRFHAGDF